MDPQLEAGHPTLAMLGHFRREPPGDEFARLQNSVR